MHFCFSDIGSEMRSFRVIAKMDPGHPVNEMIWVQGF